VTAVSAADRRAQRDAHGRLLYEPAAGDVVVMRRAHVCGAERMVVTRAALDVRLVCSGCGAKVTLTRTRLRSQVAAVGGTVADVHHDRADG
jgi:hypothetical protein